MFSSRLLLGTVLALHVGIASAVTISEKNSSSLGSNVIFNNTCTGAVTGPATNVQGCLNSNRSALVNFSDDTNLTVNGGQARVEGGSNFNSLTIGFLAASSGFKDIVFNINTDHDNEDGDVRFVVALFGSASNWISGSYDVDDGQNFFTISAGVGELIDWIRIESLSGRNSVLFDDVRQIRMTGPVTYSPSSGGPGGASDPVPAPGTLVLLGAGVAALALGRKPSA